MNAGQWILDRHAEAESEASITGLLDGDISSRDRPDFHRRAGSPLDHRLQTSSHEGGSLETFLEAEETAVSTEVGEIMLAWWPRGRTAYPSGLYIFRSLGAWLDGRHPPCCGGKPRCAVATIRGASRCIGKSRSQATHLATAHQET